jgi:hypothetical protein
MNRLKQFWNFGHNCAVLGFSREHAEETLIENRFNSWALNAKERAEFFKGFDQRPLKWDRKNLRPIDVRPIVHEPSQNLLYEELPSRKSRSTVLSEETRKKIGAKTSAYWQSSEGFATREKIRQRYRVKN